MSKRSAVTRSTRFQYHPATYSFALALLGILAIIAAVGCGGSDKPDNLPSKTYAVLGSITDCSKFSVIDAKYTLKSNGVNDSDATKIAQAIDTSVKDAADCSGTVKAAQTRVTALSDKSNAVQVSNAITGSATPLDKSKQALITQIDAALKTPTGQQYKSDLEALRKRVDDAKTQADLDKVQTDLNAKLLAVLGTTSTTTATTTSTTTVTPTPSANKDFEDAKAKLLADIDARLKDATGSLKSDLEALRKQVADQAKTVQQLLDATKELTKKLQGSPSVTTTQPGGTTTTPNNGGSVTTNTACGPITWGPAGPAPGAFTTDSPTQVREAIDVMKIPNDTKPYVTIHKACPGNDVPNGWIVGSSYTEAQGTKVSAGFLPAGTCVDYDPGATQITGTIEHTYKYHDKWWRSYLSTNGSAVGLKFTVYWTPCVFPDGYKVTTTSFPAVATTSTTAGFSCNTPPTKAADMVTVFPGTKESNWVPDPTYKYGWTYIGPEVVTLTWKDGIHHFDYDAKPGLGATKVGENPPPGSAFTVWFCA